MLSILYSDFEQFGCPNCGCDAARGSCVSGGGLSSATCRHCGLHFEVRGSTVYSTCEYAAYPEDPENPRSEVLGTKECKTYLDYRPSEPTWIQFKFDKDEFNLDAIDEASRALGGIITKEIIKQCKLNG